MQKDKYFDSLRDSIGIDKKEESVKMMNAPPTSNKSSFQVFSSGTMIQADVIYMPKDIDTREEYILTVVDVSSRAIDAIPMFERDAESVINAFEKVFENGYVDEPKYIYTDAGSEFKNAKLSEFMKERGIILRHTMTARKEQMAVVEYMNHVITKVLYEKMTSEEISKSVDSKRWVKDIANLVKRMNERHKTAKKKKIGDFFKAPKITLSDKRKLLKEGDQVRYKLTQRRDVLTNNKLHGLKFRNGDQRFSNTVHVIYSVVIYPNQPIRYLITGMTNVSFLRSQLMLADLTDFHEVVTEKKETKKAKETRVFNEELDKQPNEKEIEEHKQKGGSVSTLRSGRVILSSMVPKPTKKK